MRLPDSCLFWERMESVRESVWLWRDGGIIEESVCGRRDVGVKYEGKYGGKNRHGWRRKCLSGMWNVMIKVCFVREWSVLGRVCCDGGMEERLRKVCQEGETQR